MKNLMLISLMGAILMTACTTTSPKAVGGQKDKHGCLIGAGQTWSVLKQQCVQVFNVADIRFTDPNNETLAVYTILSEDRQQAELFMADLEDSVILTAVKGGFVSNDKKLRLLNTESGWSLRKQ